MEHIKYAIEQQNYQQAYELLKNYLKTDHDYTDTLAIIEASINMGLNIWDKALELRKDLKSIPLIMNFTLCWEIFMNFLQNITRHICVMKMRYIIAKTVKKITLLCRDIFCNLRLKLERRFRLFLLSY